MAAEAGGGELVQVVALLAAGVIAVPIFKRLGLGSVLGYLAAGLAIGPFGLKIFTDAESILHTAELGVVMFLFVIGLEMKPSRLWNLRGQIFGLGAAQVCICGGLLTALGVAYDFPLILSFIAGMGFVLSSTAIVMQILDERGETSTPSGQRSVSILLLEDLAIVPLLAMVAVLAPGAGESDTNAWQQVAISAGTLVALLLAGLFLLNPMFRLLASAHAREVMTAAALLVVLGAALAFDYGGLSMAMGAFVAGVLLSESSFRHQLEADIEPFRGILLGLFFIGVGMTLDLQLMGAQWPIIIMYTLSYMAVKMAGIYLIARLFRAKGSEALMRTALFAQGGEFAFVLYGAATAAGIFSGEQNAILTAMIILSMALTPLLVIAVRALTPKTKVSLEGVEAAEDLHGSVLIIGFGRFGQVVSQPLLARGIEISVIDADTQLIRDAADFGFKVYYGDGRRMDVLHAAGAHEARAILVCVDKRETSLKIVELIKAEYPLATIFARAFDREHALELVQAGVAYQHRETFDSALTFGSAVLRYLGVDEEEAAEVVAEVRRRDVERFEIQIGGGIYAGRDLLRTNLNATKPAKPAAAGEQHLPGPGEAAS